jgi:hypothetical protein
MQELRKLKHSFDHWKETFKKRMRDTYAFVQRARTHHNRRQLSGSRQARSSGVGHVPATGVHHASPDVQHPQPQHTESGTARIPGSHSMRASSGYDYGSPRSSELESTSPNAGWQDKMRDSVCLPSRVASAAFAVHRLSCWQIVRSYADT